MRLLGSSREKASLRIGRIKQVFGRRVKYSGSEGPVTGICKLPLTPNIQPVVPRSWRKQNAWSTTDTHLPGSASTAPPATTHVSHQVSRVPAYSGFGSLEEESSSARAAAIGGPREGSPRCSRIARVASGGWIAARILIGAKYTRRLDSSMTSST